MFLFSGENRKVYIAVDIKIAKVWRFTMKNKPAKRSGGLESLLGISSVAAALAILSAVLIQNQPYAPPSSYSIVERGQQVPSAPERKVRISDHNPNAGLDYAVEAKLPDGSGVSFWRSTRGGSGEAACYADIRYVKPIKNPQPPYQEKTVSHIVDAGCNGRPDVLDRLLRERNPSSIELKGALASQSEYIIAALAAGVLRPSSNWVLSAVKENF